MAKSQLQFTVKMLEEAFTISIPRDMLLTTLQTRGAITLRDSEGHKILIEEIKHGLIQS